jgi:O-antigen/teichoic acid export membrane protein
MPNNHQEMRNSLRTLEIVYWGISIILALTIFLSAPWIAHTWIQADGIPEKVIESAVKSMGLALSLQYPFKLYQGGLMGLQRQGVSNAILAGMGILRGLGAIFILWFISTTIQAFFVWQILINIVQIGLSASFLWISIPRSLHPPHFKVEVLSKIWRYATGMTIITILSTLLIQMDKMLLSKVLPLKDFGYYALAGMVSQVPLLFSGPITNAVFPQFTQLFTINDNNNLIRLYHRTCQLLSILAIPAGVILALFSKEIVYLWTGNAITTQEIYVLVSLLVIGSILLTLQTVPYYLALASGWTGLNLLLGILQVILYFPLMIILVNRFGAIGACGGWILLNGITIPIYMFFLHKRLLPTEQGHWYLIDVGLPLLISLMIILPGRILLKEGIFLPRGILFLYIGGLSFLAVIITGLISPEIRNVWAKLLRQLYQPKAV